MPRGRRQRRSRGARSGKRKRAPNARKARRRGSSSTRVPGRFRGQGPTEPEEEMLRPEAKAETEPAAIPREESAPTTPAVLSEEGGDDGSREEVAQRTASGPDT